ncbi:MAG: PQQ-binding-like beta-propeller repeat protein, partial [Planctomycetota bacterium]
GGEPAAWQAATGFEDSSIGWFQQALDEHRRQSIPVLPRLNPVVAGRAVIGRTLNRLFAFDLLTGQPLWRADSAATGSQRPSRAALTGSLESLAATGTARQVQLDTAYSRMTVDDGRLICVEQVSGFGRTLSGAGGLDRRTLGDDPQLSNQLTARGATDGVVLWTQSPFIQRDDGVEPVNGYFCGTPSVLGGWLVGVLQHDAVLFVYAIDRVDGTPEWSLRIGERSGTNAADSDWSSIGCVIAESEGLLVCSTGAGLIAAVDPVYRRIAWTRRYRRADEPPAGSPLPGAANRLTRRWWWGWRDVTSVAVSGPGDVASLVYAGPDVTGVFVLDPATGAERARIEAPQPLFLDVLNGDGDVEPTGLLVARHSLTAFDPVGGAVTWTVPISEPAGRGCIVDAHYLFPATDGTTRFVSLRNGSMTSGPVIDAGTPRSWTLSALGVVEQTFDDVQLLPAPSVDDDGLMRWSRGTEGGGDPLIEAIRRTDSIDQLRSFLRRTGLMEAPESEPLPGTLAASGFDRPGPTHAVAAIQRARELDADRLAFDLLLQLSQRNPNGAVSLRENGPARVVRYDRWIQGQLAELLSGERSQDLSVRFAAIIRKARESRDPFALSRLVERLRDVPRIAAAEVQPDGRVGWNFVKNEIALHRLAAATDDGVAREAKRQLVELYLAHRYQTDAADVVAGDQRLQPVDRVDGETDPLLPAKQTADLQATARQPVWQGRTQVAERPDRFQEVRYFPVPIECQQGALFKRLNVAVRLVGKSGSSLRFYGDGQAGYWGLALPPSDSPLHTWFTLPRGWALGRLLILRIGTELYGITPYADNGEPRAQLRWTLDMADGNRLSKHQLRQAVPGFRAEDLTPFDAFDRPMAQVGPVCAGYLCYRDRGQLICLDPETGQQVWSRAEVTGDVECCGDERSVWLIDEDSGDVTQLNAIDGAERGRFRFNGIAGMPGAPDGRPDRLLSVQRGRALIARGSDSTQAFSLKHLAVVDLSHQTTVWSIDTAVSDVIFAVGRHWVGLLNDEGRLQLRDIQTGHIVATHQVARPASVRSAGCCSDERSHIVALSSETDAGFQAVGEPRFGYRSPLVNGQLIAIDAFDGRLLWQQRVSGERFPLDQPRSLPVLVLSSRPEQAGGGAGNGGHVLRFMDRRNGETLMRRKSSEQVAPFTFDPNAALQRVVVRFARSALKIEYDRQQ